MSALSSGKIYKYAQLTNKETSPSDQNRIKEQTKFAYYSFGKEFEKNKQKQMKIKKKKQSEAFELLNTITRNPKETTQKKVKSS